MRNSSSLDRKLVFTGCPKGKVSMYVSMYSQIASTLIENISAYSRSMSILYIVPKTNATVYNLTQLRTCINYRL